MILDKIGRDVLRQIEVGNVGVFQLPDMKSVYAARSVLSQMKAIEGLEFERMKSSDPLTLIYKRIK